MKKASPNVAVETFLALVKYFLYIIIAINLIWATIFTVYIHKSFNGTSVEMQQDGTNNNQSMTNG